MEVCECIFKENFKTGSRCWPWKVEYREGVGRMVVAVRDIECLEIVLEDQPVALAPTQVMHSKKF